MDVEVKDNLCAYCKTLYITDKTDFPRGSSYNFSKQYPSVADKEFVINELKKHIEDIEFAIEYFKDYNPREVKDQLEYLGFTSLNPQNISFSIMVDNTEILIQIPSGGICFDYGLFIRPGSNDVYQDYSFKNLDETIKFLME